MSAFYLFGGDRYYPRGGGFDYQGTFVTLEEAKAASEGRGWDWWHVYRVEGEEWKLAAVDPDTRDWSPWAYVEPATAEER